MANSGDAPKRFGGITPSGEADVRALHGIDIPFASVFTPDRQVFKKAVGRDEVYKISKEVLDIDRYVWFTTVYTSTNGRHTYRSGDNYHGFKFISSNLAPLTSSERRLYEGGFVGTSPNQTFVVNSTANQMTSYNNELSLGVPAILNNPQIQVKIYNDGASFTLLASNQPDDRVVVWMSGIFYAAGSVVRPFIAVKKDGAWYYSSLSFNPSYDHVVRNFYVLTPSVSAAIVMHVQIGQYYSNIQNGVTRSTGSASLPAPYMLVSTDGGLSYSIISAAYLISGITFPTDITYSSLWTNKAGMTALNDTYMVWGPRLNFTPPSFGLGGPANQTSVWVGTNLGALTAATDIPQGGYSSVVVTPAFTNTRYNLIGLIREQDATSFENFTIPADLVVTEDFGQTWSVRPLPAAAYYTLDVFATDREEICTRVIDQASATISVYRSRDFGVTWVKGEQVATNVKTPSALNFRDIRGASSQVRMGISPKANSAQDPMTPSRYDARLKPEPYKP